MVQSASMLLRATALLAILVSVVAQSVAIAPDGKQVASEPTAESAPARRSEYADSDVIEANTAQLQEMVADASMGTLVTFYAPWCGHCIKMVPEFKKAATMLKASNIRAAAVNSDNEPGLAQSLGIRGFPTIRFVYNGQWSDYKGPRAHLDIVQFATQQNIIAKVKSKVSGAVKATKLAMSKVLNRQAPPTQPST